MSKSPSGVNRGKQWSWMTSALTPSEGRQPLIGERLRHVARAIDDSDVGDRFYLLHLSMPLGEGEVRAIEAVVRENSNALERVERLTPDLPMEWGMSLHHP